MVTFGLYFVKNNHLQFYFHEKKYSTRQTGRAVYDFHLPKGLDTRIGELASPNLKPWAMYVQRDAILYIIDIRRYYTVLVLTFDLQCTRWQHRTLK